MTRFKLLYFGHIMRTPNSLEKFVKKGGKKEKRTSRKIEAFHHSSNGPFWEDLKDQVTDRSSWRKSVDVAAKSWCQFDGT